MMSSSSWQAAKSERDGSIKRNEDNEEEAHVRKSMAEDRWGGRDQQYPKYSHCFLAYTNRTGQGNMDP